MFKNKKKKAILVLFALIFAFSIILATLNVSGITVFAEHDHSSDTALTSTYLKTLQKYDDDQDCNYYDLPSGNYYLSGDVNISYSIRIQNGASVSLCLNGYTLEYVGSSQYRYPVVEVIGSETYKKDVNGDDTTVVDTVTRSSLTITDCSYGEVGKLSGGNNSGSVIKSYLADITIESGNITGGRGTIVYDPYNNNAKLDATQAAIKEESGSYDAASCYTNYKDGSDEVTYVGYAYGDESFYLQGGGIYALDTNLTITGGVVYGNGAVTASATYNGETVKQYLRWTGKAGWGGDGYKMTQAEAVAEGYVVSDANGIYVDDDGYVYRTFSKGDQIDFQREQGGGIFIGTSYEWSGVCVANESRNTERSTFVMSGGSISNNACGLHGAGMFVHNVDFTMKGGVIGGSTTYMDVYNADGITIDFINGGNTSVQTTSVSGVSGGGIYVYRGAARGNGNEINITGTAEISYNESVSNAAFTIGEGSNVSISGNINISHNHSTGGAIASVSSSDFSMTGGVFEYNTTDSGQAGLSVTISASSYDDTITEVYGTYNIKIKNCYFRYNQSGTLGDDTTNGASGNGPLSVSVGTDFSNVVEIQGVTVTDNTFTGSYGIALTGGKVTVKDCTVTNNQATGYYKDKVLQGASYPGVYISRPITLTFTDCTITGNSSTDVGAVGIQGADLGSGTTYNISNLVISNNTVTGKYSYSTGTTSVGSGRALYILNGTSGTAGSVYNLSNVTITNNEHYGSNGGLYVASSTYGTVITMTDCNISNNTCTSAGGGVWLGYNVTATMTYCTISNNTAGIQGSLNSDEDAVATAGTSGAGGGIYLNAASAGSTTMAAKSGAILKGSGLTILGNTATNQGGGIYVGAGTYVTYKTYVTALGTVVDGASVTLDSSSNITDNHAPGYYSTTLGSDDKGRYDGITGGTGGGVYVSGGYVTTASTVIDAAGDKDTYNYYVGYVGTFTMNGGSISGNTSLNNGGGIWSAGTVSLTNVNVNNNQATGMYKNYYLKSAANNSDQKNNVGKGLKANGGGIYVATTNNGYIATNKQQYASLTISGGSVSGNSTNGDGAGLYLNGYSLTVSIDSCSINNNISSGGYYNGTSTTTYGTTAQLAREMYNYSYGSGGGLYISSVYKVTISNSSISYNSVAGSGGGIYITSSYSNEGDTSSNSNAVNGTYKWSRIVYASEITISNTNITNNEATGYVSNETTTNSSYTTYTAGQGGGIYLSGYSYTFTMTGGSLSNNSANDGGGLYQTASYGVTISGVLYTDFSNNTTDYESATFDGVTISGNEATLYETTTYSTANASGSSNKEYATITTQHTGGYGGGIYVANTTALPLLTLKNDTTVSGNLAEYNGGGIYIGNNSATNYAAVTLDSSSVTANYTKYATYNKTVLTYKNNNTEYESSSSTTTMNGYGAGVFVAGQYAQLIVSGTAVVSGNGIVNESAATANNVYLNSTTTYILVGDLSTGACIYVTSNSGANDRQIAKAYNEQTISSLYSYFSSDSSTYSISYKEVSDVVYVTLSTSKTSAGGSVDYDSSSFSAGAGDSEAFSLTITLTATNATITGTTSGYYEQYSELNATTAEFKIIIDDGYYFSSIVVDGVTYSFANSTSNLTSSGEATVKLVSKVEISATTSYITVTITYVSDVSKLVKKSALAYSISVTAAEVGDAFYVGYVDQVSVSSSATSFTTSYDGAGKTVTVYKSTGTGIDIYVSSFSVQYLVEGSWVDDAPKAIGTYSIRVKWAQTGYVGGTTYGGSIWTMTIVAQEWSDSSHENVTATLSVYTYDYAMGATYLPTVTVTDDVVGTLTVDTDYVITYSGNSGAGTGVVTITGIGNYTGSFTVTYTINKVETLTATDNITSTSATYTGSTYNIQLGTYTVAEDYSGSILYTITREDSASLSTNEYIVVNGSDYSFSYLNAGVYNITIYIDGDANYESGSYSIVVTINKGSSSIDISKVSNTAITYSGGEQSYNLTGASATTGGASANITYSIYNSTADGASISNGTLYVTNAGTYTVAFTVAETDNYAGAVEYLTFTVNKLSLTVPSYTGSNSFVYDGNSHTLNIGSYQSAYISVNGNAQTEVGTYNVTLSLIDTANTEWTDGTVGNKTHAYTITQADNVITAGGNSSYTYTYNGTAQGVSEIAITSAFSADDMAYNASTGVNASYTGNKLTFTVTDAGSYTITFTSLGGSNYTADTYTITITVYSAVNTITAGGSSSYNYTYNGGANTVSDIAVASAFDSDNMTYLATEGLEVTYSGGKLTFAATNAGSYTITFTSTGNENYSAQTYTITITVAAVENTLTASSQTTEYKYIYNGSAQSVSLGSITAAQGGDIAAVVLFNDAASSYTVTTGESGYSFSFTRAGVYTITFTSATSANYSSDAITVTITVEKAANGITMGDIAKTYTYSGGSQSIDLNSVVASFGTIDVTVSNGGSYSDGKAWIENAGNYTITFNVVGTDDYDGATATLAVVVSPYSLDKPIATGASYTYTGEAQTFAFTSDADASCYTVSGNERTNAGTYYVYVTLNDTANYTWADGTVNTLSYTFTIAKATPSYTVPTGLSYTAGTVLSTITLPSGWAWSDATAKVSSSVSGYSAVYTPADTDNYMTVTATITIEVKTATVSAGVSSDVRGEVSASSGFTETVSLNVNTVETSSYDAEEDDIVETVVSQTTLDNAAVVSVYEINLTSASGTELTVASATDDNYITVTVAIPTDAIGSDFYIVHIHDGEIIDVLDSSEYTVSNGYVTFTVEQLSQFAFVVEAATDVAQSTVLIFAVVDVVLIAAAVVLLAVNNRRKRRAKAL